MVGNAHDAQDLLQDVLLSVYRNLANFRGDAPFVAWIFRIATFRCTDHLRKKRLNTTEYDETLDGSLNSSPSVTFETAQTNGQIVQLMNLLPAEQRQVIELKFFQNFTFDEIAVQLGISSNTAKSRLYAPLKKMRGSDNPTPTAC